MGCADRSQTARHFNPGVLPDSKVKELRRKSSRFAQDQLRICRFGIARFGTDPWRQGVTKTIKRLIEGLHLRKQPCILLLAPALVSRIVAGLVKVDFETASAQAAPASRAPHRWRRRMLREPWTAPRKPACPYRAKLRSHFARRSRLRQSPSPIGQPQTRLRWMHVVASVGNILSRAVSCIR